MEKQVAEKGTRHTHILFAINGKWWALGANKTGNRPCSHRIPLLVLPAAKERLMAGLQLSEAVD